MGKELDKLVSNLKEANLSAVDMWNNVPEIAAKTEYHGDFIGALERNGIDPKPWIRSMKGEVLLPRDGSM